MKWFKRWFSRKVAEAIEYDQDDHFEEDRKYSPAKMSSHRSLRTATVSRSSDIDSEEGLNITVRSAVGGRIITFRRYDHRNDTNTYKLYVIHDELDFDKELGKIITLESMCQRA